MNPFDLPGPQFLVLYVALLPLIGLAVWLRWHLMQPADEPSTEALALTPYEIAFLAGGGQLAGNAAIASLVHRGFLTVEAGEYRLHRTLNVPSRNSVTELEKAIYNAVDADAGSPIIEVRKSVSEALEPMSQRLQELGLLVSPFSTVHWLPLLLALSVPAIGVIKIFVGVSRGKPVEFLVFLCIATGIGIAVLLGWPVFRSRRGDTALEQLKDANAAMEYSAGRHGDDMTGDDLVLSLGLFGMGVLAGGPLADLRTSLLPPPGKNSGGSCSSGCSSSSSCGGGCGGGGCGGCGG